MKMTTQEELLKSTKISDAIFGGHIDVDRQLAWLKRNPEHWVRSQARGKGSRLYYHTTTQAREDRKTNARRKNTPSTSNRKKSKRSSQDYLTPLWRGNRRSSGITFVEKRTYGSRLVGGLIDALIELGKRGIVFETITARSTKPNGIRLLREIYSSLNTINFDGEESSSSMCNLIRAREIMQYKQALKEYELRTSDKAKSKKSRVSSV